MMRAKTAAYDVMTDTFGNFFDFGRDDLERANICSFSWVFESNDPSVSWLRIIVLLPLVLLQGHYLTLSFFRYLAIGRGTGYVSTDFIINWY